MCAHTCFSLITSDIFTPTFLLKISKRAVGSQEYGYIGPAWEIEL
jgi:hypothetical protein